MYRLTAAESAPCRLAARLRGCSARLRRARFGSAPLFETPAKSLGRGRADDLAGWPSSFETKVLAPVDETQEAPRYVRLITFTTAPGAESPSRAGSVRLAASLRARWAVSRCCGVRFGRLAFRTDSGESASARQQEVRMAVCSSRSHPRSSRRRRRELRTRHSSGWVDHDVRVDSPWGPADSARLGELDDDRRLDARRRPVRSTAPLLSEALDAMGAGSCSRGVPVSACIRPVPARVPHPSRFAVPHQLQFVLKADARIFQCSERSAPREPDAALRPNLLIVPLPLRPGAGFMRGFPEWAQLGSNQRPPACEAGALPLSYAPRGAQV